MNSTETPIISMRHISKSFPGVRALTDVNLDLAKGEVHGLMGENGAGKSTLMNILAGIHQPDSGEIRVNGEVVTFPSVHASQGHGLAIIHQELALEPYLSIAENVFLGRQVRNAFGLVSQSEMEARALPYLKMVGMSINPATKVHRLSTGQQQMIEIAKALSLNSQVLVMDEPSSSLSESEVRVLFDVVRKLRSEGIGIIYISHKLSEIFELTDRVTVLRDGQYVITKPTAETTEAELVRHMVGRDLESYYHRTFNEPGAVALRAENISLAGVKDCSFAVRSGEVLGFYGLIGAGRSELARAIMGIDRGATGTVYVHERALPTLSPDRMLANKVAFVPESRKTEGLFLFNTVAFNITITVLERFIRNLRVNVKKEDEIVDKAIKEFAIKTPSANQMVRTLSGGNQQKIVLSKWLLTDPEVLILDEPTRGIDVGAKSEIYRTVNSLAAAGRAIILISSEMNELINMSDRIVVMAHGEIVATVDRANFDPDLILSHAIGVEAA